MFIYFSSFFISMKKEPFLLVSLEENESEKLAQVISNKTSRKILDHLSKEESATESDISKKLSIPISTVHYNIQALMKANLLEAEEFHYSEKGKEVLHYSLANKLIIIAPKKTSAEGFKDKLKALFPVALISVGASIVVGLTEFIKTSTTNAVPMFLEADMAMKQASARAVPEAMMFADEALGAGTPVVANQTSLFFQNLISNPGFWFLIGALFTILVFLVWQWFATRKK
jgi:DNA-binding transcriptional ArsR family regulator